MTEPNGAIFVAPDSRFAATVAWARNNLAAQLSVERLAGGAHT